MLDLRTALPCSLLVLVASCAGPASRPGEPEPYVPLPDREGSEDLGFFLADFQTKMQLWNKLKLELDPDEDPREFHALERDMQRRARRRVDELIEALEGNSPVNQATAAVALGFTLYADAVSPLLSALSDDDDRVAQNAALGLGLLAWPGTNLAPLRFQLTQHRADGVRSNCAYALLEITAETKRREAGGLRGELGGSSTAYADLPELSEVERVERDAVLGADCLLALRDPEEGVRVQAAAILGLLRDERAFEPLTELLYDEWNLPANAAATALVHVGREHARLRGPVARALVDALDRVEKPRAAGFRRQLGLLAGRDLGPDLEDWRAWAYELP